MCTVDSYFIHVHVHVLGQFQTYCQLFHDAVSICHSYAYATLARIHN